MKKKYKIPIGTKVEIITENDRFNGLIGTLGAKTTDGLPAYKVCYDSGGFDCYMDYEIVPLQNIITIDNLEYETLCKIFEHDYLYETDRIIVKQKKFSEDEIETALEKYTGSIAKIFSKNADLEDGISLNHRGAILELLNSMLDDEYDNNLNISTAIEETIVYQQWWIEGFRKHLTWNGKDEREPRYFNPEAKIETIYI